ncbi:MAG: hypothetical protein QOD93_6556, partial [Acetobacteraceae bacterium]|nr:hypothetical protein [Acetobacteraceae bacterium]
MDRPCQIHPIRRRFRSQLGATDRRQRQQCRRSRSRKVTT